MDDLGPFDVSSGGEHRRYHVTSLLGQGGFGAVYRARLVGADGFVKDVAVKMLHDPDPPLDVVTRFRDEARLLGLIRHPNIVNVDPPVRLNGRWAVVMEFVDGVSVDELIRGTVLPPAVALEITEVVAHVLHDLWSAEGPDGRPLRLIHRDLKPSNVQITPNGFVKVLDFGVARADFEARETFTSHSLGGTPGYIAPERNEGHDTPASDVFSLGVMLRRLVQRSRRGETASIDAPRDVAAVLAISARMRDPDPDRRPSAAEVARQCRDLRATLPPLELRDWARSNVANAPSRPPDGLVGQTLSETLSPVMSRLRSRVVPMQPAAAPPSRAPVLLALIVAFASFGVVLLAGFLAMVVVWSAWIRPQTARPQPAPAPLTAPASPSPVVAAPEPPPEPAPIPAPPEPPPPAPAPTRTSRPPPTPEPVAVDAPPEVAFGAVSVIGEASSVVLTCGGVQYAPGPVPAGSCQIRATFDGAAFPAGSVTVPPGGQVVLECLAAFQRCRTR